MLVVSAGIGELIKASFETISEENGYSYEDLKPFNLVSNLGVYEDNILVKFNKPYVHIMNKAGHVKKFIDLQKQLDEESHHHLRGNIIVMGDVIEDLKMIAEISYDNIIKVGYLNNPTQDSHLIEEYEKVFDIVILNDGNLWPIVSIIDVVAGRKISCKDKLTPEFLSFIEEFE